jgi:hypothetical protein
LTEEVPKEMGQEYEKRPRLVWGLNNVENVVYYGASLYLLAMIGVLFVSTGADLLAVREEGTLRTARTVLDRVILIFIFVELLHTIGVVVAGSKGLTLSHPSLSARSLPFGVSCSFSPKPSGPPRRGS